MSKESETIVEHLFGEKEANYYLSRLKSFGKEYLLEFRMGLGEGEWRRVIAHELVEAEACDVLGEALGLSKEERLKLFIAARVHDIDKKIEIEKKPWSSNAQKEQYKIKEGILRNAGYDQEIINLTKVTGWDGLAVILSAETRTLSEEIIHYADDIVSENKIVSLRQRLLNSLRKPHIRILSKDGMKLYGGKSFSRVGYGVSAKIEAKFAEKLGVKDPSCLPEFINEKIVERIEKFASK